MRRFVPLFLLLLLGAADAWSQLIEVVEATNRSPRAMPILIDSAFVVVRDAQVPFNPVKLRLKRCDNGADVPFCLDPWTPGTDSVMIWFRLDNVAAQTTVVIRVELDQTIATSRSDGKAVFINYSDSLSAAAGAGQAGPWSGISTNTPAAFGRGFIIDARMTATAPTGGFLCYYGTDAIGSSGYSIKHEARAASTEPDHWSLASGVATDISVAPKNFIWNTNETVRYFIVMNDSLNLVSRYSEADRNRRHFARFNRPAGQPWTMFGAASLPSATGDLRVSYIRMRPNYDIRPRTTRRGALVQAAPSNAVICDGAPVILSIIGTGWRTITWSNGATGPAISVTTPGTYFADLTDGAGCSVRTEVITVGSGNAPKAGSDTTFTLCLGRRETLSVTSGYDSYEWYLSAGANRVKLPFTGPTAEVDSADVYRCFVRSASGCLDTVRFIVNRVYDTTGRIVTPRPNPAICEGDSLVLTAEPAGSAEYQWSRDGVILGTNTNRLVVRDSGNYAVLIRLGTGNNGCLSLAKSRVDKSFPDTLRFLSDYSFCEGDSVVLDPGRFSTGEWWSYRGGRKTTLLSSNRSFVAKVSDTVLCIASNAGLCPDTAIIALDRKDAPANPITVVEGKKSMCRGEILTLQTQLKGFGCTWMLDSTRLDASNPDPVENKTDSAVIQIRAPGTYYVLVDYRNGCIRKDSIVIDNGIAPPDIVAPDGIVMCPGDSIRLTTLGKFTTYLWSNGQTKDTIYVTQPGNYSVTVTLFGCEAKASIRVELADPKGPVLAFRDSTMVCNSFPWARLTFGNPQGVEREYNIDVVDKTQFEASATRFIVKANDTGSVGFRYIGNDPNARFLTFSVRLSDDCEWKQEVVLTVEIKEKTVPLSIKFSKPPTALRAGDNFTIRIEGSSRAGLPDFTRRDTLWIETSVPSDLLQVTGTRATCGDPFTNVSDSSGRVRFSLADCATSTADPLVEQQLSVLVGETLRAFIQIDTIYSSSPCITAPLEARRVEFDLLPFGCELSTITRARTLIMGIGSAERGSVTAVITESNGPVTVRAVDVLGRVIDTATIPDGEGARQCTLNVDAVGPVYITAVDGTSVVTVPLAGVAR
jgi:hypothetical protein